MLQVQKHCFSLLSSDMHVLESMYAGRTTWIHGTAVQRGMGSMSEHCFAPFHAYKRQDIGKLHQHHAEEDIQIGSKVDSINVDLTEDAGCARKTWKMLAVIW